MNQSMLMNNIKALQKQLINLTSAKGSLTDIEVVSKSEELDKYILEYIKLTAGSSK